MPNNSEKVKSGVIVYGSLFVEIITCLNNVALVGIKWFLFPLEYGISFTFHFMCSIFPLIDLFQFWSCSFHFGCITNSTKRLHLIAKFDVECVFFSISFVPSFISLFVLLCFWIYISRGRATMLLQMVLNIFFLLLLLKPGFRMSDMRILLTQSTSFLMPFTPRMRKR